MGVYGHAHHLLRHRQLVPSLSRRFPCRRLRTHLRAETGPRSLLWSVRVRPEPGGHGLKPARLGILAVCPRPKVRTAQLLQQRAGPGPCGACRVRPAAQVPVGGAADCLPPAGAPGGDARGGGLAAEPAGPLLLLPQAHPTPAERLPRRDP